MILGRLSVSLGNTGIKYNHPEELGTAMSRGSVLESGAVVRGLGTHFASKADKDRYDLLVKQSNQVRTAFAEKFIRFGFFDSTFVLKEMNEGVNFAEEYRRTNSIDPAVIIDVMEGEYVELGNSLTTKREAEWSQMIKDQLERVQLGRKKDTIQSSALDAMESLADCPALNELTSNAIRSLVREFRAGSIKKDDFQRGIQLMDVKVNKQALSADSVRRVIPQA